MLCIHYFLIKRKKLFGLSDIWLHAYWFYDTDLDFYLLLQEEIIFPLLHAYYV